MDELDARADQEEPPMEGGEWVAPGRGERESQTLRALGASVVVLLLWTGILSAQLWGWLPLRDVDAEAGKAREQATSRAFGAVMQLLAEEADARRTLERELEIVWEQMGELESRTPPIGEQTEREASAASVPAAPAPPPFDADALVEAGVDPREADELRALHDEIELERLYLEDRATREGWLGTRRYREERRALDARFEALREELGEQDFDRLLFAIGRPNRVEVREVLEGSPAQEAGLEAGDRILRYDEARVFRARDLQALTTAGQAGETVPVDVERDGAERRLYVPRGPLGLHLRALREPPG